MHEPSPMRDFDPRRLADLEFRAWVSYYRRDWASMLRAAVGMVRVGFGMSWLRTVRGALLVLRATRAWAPYPDNDPEKARRLMQRFYELLADAHDETFDARRAAELEVEWWRVHRHAQRDDPAVGPEPLVEALAATYAHVYRAPVADVRAAAAKRAEAMRVSDAWVAAGQDSLSPLLAEEHAALVRSYAALLAAVYRVPQG